MTKSLRVSVSPWLVIMLVLGVAATAHAQAQVEFIPSISLFTVFDDNVFASADGDAGRMLQARPTVEGSYATPTVQLLGLYSFDMQRSNFSSLNTFDARRHGLGTITYQATPFTTLDMTGRYDRSSNPGDIEFDTGILGERRTAERLELTPAIARRIGPRLVLAGGYSWTTERHIDGERGSMQIGRVTLSRDVNTRTVIGGGYVARYFVDHIGNIPNSNSHTVLATWSRELTPATTLTLAGGPQVRSGRGMDYEASAGFARNTPSSQLAFDYWHGETIVLGVAGPVDVDSGTARMSWPIRRRWVIATAFGASNVVTIDDRSGHVFGGTVVGTWNPGGIYSIGASYGADFQDGSIRNPVFLDGEQVFFDQRVLRHVFQISVTLAPRYARSILPPDEAARNKGVTR